MWSVSRDLAAFSIAKLVFLSLSLSCAFAQSGTVERVEDGDTIVLSDGTVMRLWGIQAPEPGEPGYKDPAEGFEAFVVGEHVDCFAALRGPQRSEGRLVSWCRLGGFDLSEYSVIHGYSFEWPEFSGEYFR